jgi:diguanylate cyclase (GGDEF)-like protein
MQMASMSGAGFVLTINLFVAALLAASFMAIATYDPRRRSARWFALGYCAGIVYLLLEFVIASFGSTTLLAVIAYGTFLAALVIINVGIAHKYDVRVPWTIMAVVSAAAMTGCYVSESMPRDSFMRMVIYQSPYFILQAIAVGIVAQARKHSALDYLLMALLAGSSLQFLSKPFLFRPFGGTGASAGEYLGTEYALVSQSMGTIFAIAVALMLLIVLMRDVLGEANARSETDVLSGLLNRGGFEAHSTQAMRDAAGRGVPVSLVISDLDHFKEINDTFGHAAGDNVIVAFARFLRSAMAEHHVAGRIGGEEFAILLPGTNLVAARLFAEGARNAFSSLPIDGVPLTKRVTASFGVAEMARDETIAGLMARADKALYIAKNSGRDCVKIAQRPGPHGGGQGAAISLV